MFSSLRLFKGLEIPVCRHFSVFLSPCCQIKAQKAQKLFLKSENGWKNPLYGVIMDHRLLFIDSLFRAREEMGRESWELQATLIGV